MILEKTKNAKRNMLFGTLQKLTTIVTSFIMRTIILYSLGTQYLGLSSLFSSVLSVLNLAELGVGSAMVFSMYKPIADDDEKTICALLNLYKKYYRIIGAVILSAGVLISPFIPKLISGGVPDDINVYIIYFINLTATVLTYWLFAYRNSIFQAHQRVDVVEKVNFVAGITRFVVEILVLILTHNYYIYICVTLLCQIVINCTIAVLSKKFFPQYRPEGKLSRDEVKDINQRIKDLFTSKVGGTIVASADTIVISSFLGLEILAIYQNYYYILSSVLGLFSILHGAVLAGIGNSLITKKKDNNYQDFKIFSMIIAWLCTFCVSSFAVLYQPFVTLWVGEDLLLEYSLVILLCIYFWVYEYVMSLSVYNSAAGVWHYDRFRPLISGLLNLVVNLALVKFIGLYGIVLSTILSVLFVSAPWITHNVFKWVLKENEKQHILKQAYYFLVASVITATSVFVTSFITWDGWLGLIVKAIICLFLPNILVLIAYRPLKEYKGTMNYLSGALHLDKIFKVVRK